MVFKEEAYKEVFPDVVIKPSIPKQESMINDDQEDNAPAETEQVEQAQLEEVPADDIQSDQEEGAE